MVRILLILLLMGNLWSQENHRGRQVIFGGETQPWQSFVLENTQVKSGSRGSVVTLRDRSGDGSQPSIDLFLSFEEESINLVNYRVQNQVSITRQISRFGTGAGFFQEDPKGMELQAGSTALFFPGNLWHDFKIEFWTYLPSLTEGASVLTWRGALKEGNEVLTQELRISLRGRVMELRAKNFFRMPRRGAPEIVALAGRRPMLPGRWVNHRFQFDASTGLFEYYRDGIPETSLYVTSTGREGGQVFVPYIGELSRPVVHLGENLSGILDEFQITRQVDSLAARTSTYDASRGSPLGYAVSPIVDLGDYSFVLEQVSTEAEIPTGTRLGIQVRVGDVLDWSSGRSPQLQSEWQQWPTRQNQQLRGRYVQVRLRFDGDGSGERSPILERVVLSWSKIPEPLAPTLLSLREGQDLELSWRPVADHGVRSYRVFWSLSPNGFDPSKYFVVKQDFGQAFSWDNGERPRIRFKISPQHFVEEGEAQAAQALRMGRLFYFVVTSVKELPNPDGSSVNLLSPFSETVSGRRMEE